MSREEPIFGAFILALVVTLFIPGSIALQIGPLTVTPAFAVSILLVPMLMIWGRIRWAWPEWVVVLLFFCFFISTVRSSSIERSIESIGRGFLSGFVPYLAGRYVVQDISRLSKFLGLIVLMTAVFAIFALIESVQRFNIHCAIWDVPYRPHKDMRLGLTRAHAWTSHAIVYGLVNAVFLPIVAVAMIEKLRLVGRWPIFKALALGLGCFLSLSVSAWGPAALTIAFVGWDYLSKIKPKIRWPMTAAVLIGGYFVLEVASGRPLLRILMMQLHLSSPLAWHYRWKLYERVFAVMQDCWWLGHGLDTPPAFQHFGRSIDNNYLVVLLMYGLIGMTVWIGLFVSVICYGGKAVWAGYDTSYVRFTRAIMFGLVGIMMTQLSVALFSTAAVLCWLMLGMAVGASQNCRKQMMLMDAAKATKRGRQRRFRAAAARAGNTAEPSPPVAPMLVSHRQ